MEQTSENLPWETWGGAGQETWSDFVSGMYEEPHIHMRSHQACLVTGASCCEGSSVPAVKISGIGSASAGKACEWSDWVSISAHNDRMRKKV